ncbi:putative Thioredoxin domain-containing protein [Helianthus annuus]|uniref:Putative thioredoxin-like fold protein n=1 Tax=Helianthus annuus TaxID=4232 RepID=A0A251SBP1_HELAN|nr:5'-adenylylsulfate reductase-like 4 [Helianthus annuus]KAF5766410.1 putative Thioredoxin domain-containing protein [Helianthus annuus]KAJ0452797.1 putative Thioredoxin domain, 5'-adenylylsulfate reductase-like protein [Helianthus annuus]KAJ0457801.1 putative Thioredoxin domain-containing protein [Helianthus annuus]KAJ0474709.1 putative Thioredoxin domain, 5'-adenylylsulfate reductase-like protein [Helianthus annuus]KAJ0650264.1 putative Thioredoxin domain, 5'-adenylylsulfate reductase-like 
MIRTMIVLVLLVIFATPTCTEQIENPRVCDCIGPFKSMKDLVISSQSPVCSLNGIDNSSGAIGVIEGEEASLQKALNTVHKYGQSYVIVLFYASWCPFSITFRPNLSVMASLYPSISHFAIEESVVRPSILSKYGVHGFPTLFVLNSTMRARYHGSRTIDSLMAFYTNVTGIKPPESINGTSLGETMYEHEKRKMSGPESCPFSWARSPENMLQHETYLTLATIFVVLRLFYLSYPFIMTRARVSWRRRIPNIRFKSLWEHPLLYMNHAIQLFTSLTEPCKRGNLRGAMNAKANAAWASKSLASVSFGEASTSRD